MCKKTIAVIISVILAFSGLVLPISAETDADDLLSSSNIKYYANSRWGSAVTSKLYVDSNGLTRIEFQNNKVYAESFDSSFNLISSKTVDGELDDVNGVYIGQKYNFIVCSQKNTNEDDTKEVVRIIKYSKDWSRLSSASIYGANTTKFTDAGSLRFLEYGNMLYIHTSHEMYHSEDGYNHQANMTITVNTDSMKVTDDKYTISNNSTGYVSHSFNQFIAADTETDSVITVDHGDAHPRTVAIFRYYGQLGNGSLKNPQMVNLFEIAGESGDNTTGVSMGDVIVTDNNYMVSFDSIDQNGTSNARSPYLAIVPKNSFNDASVKLIKLADESDNCGYPYITDIGNGKYLAMWESEGGVAYVTVDENGTKLTGVKSFKAQCSDCEPILTGSKVIWYVTNSSAPVFYSINIKTNEAEIEKCFHSYRETTINAVNCEDDGLYQYDCIFCGDSYTATVNATGHTDSNSDGYCDKCRCNMPSENTVIEVSWEKSVYTVADGTAILNISAPSGVYMTGMSCTDSFKATYFSTKLIFDFLGTAGTYHIYLVFSNGETVHTKLTVYETAAEATTETTTQTTTELTTEYTTEATTAETTTQATTEATTETTTAEMTETTTADDIQLTTTLPNETTTEKIDITTTVPSTEQTTEAAKDVLSLGDLNGDGKITAADARAILRISAKLDAGTPEQLTAADLDGNGKINAADARKALRVAAKLETLD